MDQSFVERTPIGRGRGRNPETASMPAFLSNFYQMSDEGYSIQLPKFYEGLTW